jgi:hypothetical protein
MEKKNPSFIIPSYLELFERNGVNLCVENAFYTSVLPVSSISFTSPVEFQIPALQQCLISPSDTVLKVKFQILAKDGKAVAEIETDAAGFYSVANSTLSSLFSDVYTSVNSTLISSYNGLYSYSSHIQNILSDPVERSTDYVSRLYCDDPAGTISTAAETGGIYRAQHVKASATCTLCGPIQSGIFMEKKLLPPNANIQVKLIPNKSTFVIMSDGVEYQLKLLSAELKVKYFKIESNFLVNSLELMNEKHFSMNFIQTIPKTQIIPSGVSKISFPNIMTGKMPSLVMFTLVSNEDFNGSIKTSPLNFQPNGLSSFKISVNNQIYPSPQITFSSTDMLELYHYTIDNITRMNGRSVGLDHKRYGDGFFFVCADLTHDGTPNSHTNPLQTGCMNIDLEFSKATTKILTLIVLGTYPSELQITKSGEVMVD